MRRGWLVVWLLAACGPRPSSDAVVVAYPAGPLSLYPHLSIDEYSGTILSNVFEPLVAMDGDLALRPGLAESWHSSDELTWSFTLRPGLRLHDGRTLTAADVVQSLERARTDADSKRRAELSPVAAIEARDARTVVLRTRAPFAPLPKRLAILPIWVAPRDPLGFPVGTGPYRVSAWKPGGDTRLDAFDLHPGGPPALRTIEFRAIPSEKERIRRLRAGDVHLLSDVSIARRPELQSIPGVRIVSRHGLLVVFLAMDCARGRSPHVDTPRNPFRDVRVRRAVALAIDRAALVGQALAGQAEVVEMIVSPEAFGYDSALPARAPDRTEAIRLLSAAGFPEGFGVVVDSTGNPEDAQPVLDFLSRSLAGIGIRLRPRFQSLASLLSRVERRDTTFYMLGWFGTSGDFGSSAEYLLHTPGPDQGLANGGGYSSPEVDRRLEQAARALDDEERRRLLWEAAAIIHADVPVVPLYRAEDLYAVAGGLEFSPRLDREIRGAELRWEKRR